MPTSTLQIGKEGSGNKDTIFLHFSSILWSMVLGCNVLPSYSAHRNTEVDWITVSNLGGKCHWNVFCSLLKCTLLRAWYRRLHRASWRWIRSHTQRIPGTVFLWLHATPENSSRGCLASNPDRRTERLRVLLPASIRPSSIARIHTSCYLLQPL